MALRLAIVGALAAAIAGVVATVIVLRLLHNAVRSVMQRWLGDYYDYAAIFYVFALTVAALVVFMYFVVSLLVWLLVVGAVTLAVISLLELT